MRRFPSQQLNGQTQIGTKHKKRQQIKRDESESDLSTIKLSCSISESSCSSYNVLRRLFVRLVESFSGQFDTWFWNVCVCVCVCGERRGTEEGNGSGGRGGWGIISSFDVMRGGLVYCCAAVKHSHTHAARLTRRSETARNSFPFGQDCRLRINTPPDVISQSQHRSQSPVAHYTPPVFATCSVLQSLPAKPFFCVEFILRASTHA